MNYTNLFKKGKIGPVDLKNRIVMAPMCPVLATPSGINTPETIAHFEARAKGGVGLIITEGTIVDERHGRTGKLNAAVFDDYAITWIERLTDGIHRHGSKVFIQLQHAGPQAKSKNNGGNQIVSASAVMNMAVGEMPRKLTIDEIHEIQEKFVEGAFRSKLGGADGVELLAGHGYLLSSFLSPRYNKRNDEYGGSLKNRTRMLREIILAIKTRCPGIAVTIRLNVEEFLEDGIHEEEGVQIAKIMEEAGIDAIHVTTGTYESNASLDEPITFEQGWRVYLAEEVKKAVKIPVITVGVIREPAFADKVIEDGKADFVAIGRGLLADPEWANKAKEGRDKEIRKCISCGYCIGQLIKSNHIGCALNARCGRDLTFPELSHGGEGRKVVVVGGGPCGMEASRVLAERGFKVVLFETKFELGGQVLYAEKPIKKEKMRWAIDFLEYSIRRLGVDIRLNQEADYETIKAEDPYAVFITTGAVPLVPRLRGVDQAHVRTAESILDGNVHYRGKNVVVVGGGLTGCETAELISTWGNKVSVVEMLPDVCYTLYPPTKIEVKKSLAEENVDLYTQQRICEIKTDSIIIEDVNTFEHKEILAEEVVLSIGVRPNHKLYDEICNKFDNVLLLGDALRIGNIGYSVRDGFIAASGLT